VKPSVVLLFAALAAPLRVVAAQQPPPTAPAPQRQAPPTCAAAEHRQFDFWVGDWDVATPDGRPAGRNTITVRQAGCVVHEQWTGAGGGTGESFNIYDRRSRRWHQTWVSSTGALLLLDGGLVDSAMVLENEMPLPDGARLRNRITYARLSGGRVRQTWTQSRDGGATWTTTFEGIYTPRP
jgi:hypothetical protein